MVPGSFAARTENGHQVEDLVEDTFVMLLEDLDPEENTFVTITTFRPNGWEAVISLRADGSYQVERHDEVRGWYEVRITTDPDSIVGDLLGWFADRG